MDENGAQDPWSGLGAPPGLCSSCVHAHLTVTRRGTAYLRCLRAQTDWRYDRHPRLPVLACPGHEKPSET